MRAGWYERKGDAREVIEIGEMETPEPAPGKSGSGFTPRA